MVYTTSFAFFEALWEAGITHCFVNLGSDHPSIIEAFVRGKNEKNDQFPKLITCPNEMVALSMADGYARFTGKPQCVIIHVDVGTQGLGAAVHDASTGRSPVLIFAGLSPFTIEGEVRGSRTEYIHWIQDVPDQKQIVAQYCRYSGEIKTGKNVKQMVFRALSFAMSDPKGPVYLTGAREVMEEDIEPYQLDMKFWNPVEPTALPPAAVASITGALERAERPLLIAGYSGRKHGTISELVKLTNHFHGLKVLDTGGSDMCFPASHPAWLGLRYGKDESIKTADVIIVLDCDVPWMPTQCKPSEKAEIYHIDADPLKQLMPVFYLNAVARYKADSLTALQQLNDIASRSKLRSQDSHGKSEALEARRQSLENTYREKLSQIASLAAPAPDDTYATSYLISQVKKACPVDTLWVVEAVTNAPLVADQVQATLPGSWINCGGGGLGWSGGAALGVKLASMHEDGQQILTRNAGESVNGQTAPKPTFVCHVVGDGTFLFSVPSSVYWISARYNLPILTIVLNNNGWNAPRNSMMLVHPNGEASKASNHELNISFSPSPDYAGIAKASAGGKLWAGRAHKASELESLLQDAVEAVKSGRSAVLDAQLNGPEGKYIE